MSKKLVRSGLVVSSMTLISRCLGLVRDIVVAHLMGAGQSADVFFLANKIPNFLRRLFAEGAFAQAFIPVLTEYQEQKPDQVNQLIAKACGTLGVLVSIVTLLGVIGSPVVIAIFANGWFLDYLHDGADGQKYEMASLLLKLTFPYLWFITFAAFAGSILNSLGKFAVSAFTPVFLNISIIGFALWVCPTMEQPEIGLAAAVFVGGLVQFLFQLPFLWKLDVLVWPRWGWAHEGVQKIKNLMIPALFGVSVSQINLLLDTVIASYLMTGSISWLYYSDRLLEFPLGLFGIAIATVILPALSKNYANYSSDKFSHTMDWGVRSVVVLGAPSMAGLILLAQPMLMVLFMRGEFSFHDVEMASMSLLAYASGLLSFMLVKVLAPGFYARQDTKTPVRYGIITMASNMIFNIILAVPFGYVGLAMATALSALLNAILLYRGLVKAQVYHLSRSTYRCFFKVGVSVFVMSAGVLWMYPSQESWLLMGEWERFVTLMLLIGGAVLVYLFVFLLLGGRSEVMRQSSSST